MGVNIHFTDPKPGELEMLAQGGFRWVRMDLTWAKTEKAAGRYDFSAYDRLLANLDKFHIRVLLILDYTNALYDDNMPSHTDAGRRAFARWAVAAVTHFKDRGIIWEIWNEPNGKWFWKPKANADDYAKLALAVSQAIRQSAPDELVVGPALSGSKLDFVEVSAKAGVFAYWSGITIHPYLRTGPESYGFGYDQVRRLIEKYASPNQQIDVMCGESGYSTTSSGIDDSTQGKYLARLFLFDVMSGVPLTIWYDWHDDGNDPHNKEHNFGIVHHDYHPGAAQVYDPKPAYNAARTYSNELAGFRFKERLKTASTNDFVLSFTKDTTGCLVAWTTAPAPHVVKISAPDGIYSVTDYDGNKQPDAATSGGIMTLNIDAGPKYLKRK
jgi:polysaccharide biosynthesis protein PslG